MEYNTKTKLKKTEAKLIAAEAKVNHDTQYYRMKSEGGLPPPSPHHQKFLKELMKFKDVMIPAPSLLRKVYLKMRPSQQSQ